VYICRKTSGAGGLLLDRGYTGHEHLLGVALINMNGRIYDPKLHSFLQPDNFVQDPSNSQSFNRYAYCWNNPLRYTDLNGEWIHILIGAVVGGVINWGVHGFRLDAAGATAFGIGALAGGVGAATFGVGAIAAGATATAAGSTAIVAGSGGFLSGFVGGVMSAAASSTILSVGNHIAFGDPLMTAKEFGISMLFSGALGGVLNGLTAASKGWSFMKGTMPRPTVQPITMPTIGEVVSKSNAELEANAKLPNTTQPSTQPTTQNVTITKNLDGGYNVKGLNLDAGGKNTVYQGVDRVTGEIKYVGITERAPTIRFVEHLNSGTLKSTLDFKTIPGMDNLSRINARITEQALINFLGKGNLLNIRNSVTPINWAKYGIQP
jgi:RHS repeat-associated protein